MTSFLPQRRYDIVTSVTCTESNRTRTPSESRREKLALNYISRVKANSDNPVNDVILRPKYVELYERKPKAIRPIGIRLKIAIDNAGLQLDANREQKIPDIPPFDHHTVESFTPFVKQQKVYN